MRVKNILLTFSIAVILVLAFLPSHAQLQYKWWYFGKEAAVEFYTGGQPKVYTKGSMNALEGCASISDPNTGNLLFYSDGIHVYNQLNDTMPNGFGLRGNQSASSSALIAPVPGKKDKYYLFTTPAHPLIGTWYSVVDMTLDNGLGDVDTAQKNISLSTIASNDRMAAVVHANKQDYWILIQNDSNWNIHAFLVQSTGVSSTPVISQVTPPSSSAPTSGHYGCLQVSPDGKTLVATAGTRDNLMLFDFNDSTGVLTKQRSVTDATVFKLIYGAEFSPDSKLLYVASRFAGGSIFQLDATATDSISLSNSRTLAGYSY